MNLDQLLKKRHSCRSYKNKQANWKLVLEAIDAANHAPFAGNHNDLRFIVIENPETIKKIAELCQQTWIQEVDLLVVVCSQEEQLERLYGERGRVYNRQQAGAAIQNFLLKITELDLATCWVGAFPDNKIRNLLKIPEKVVVEAILPVGYENPSKKKAKKKKIDLVLNWEQWGESKKPTFFKDNNRHSASYM